MQSDCQMYKTEDWVKLFTKLQKIDLFLLTSDQSEGKKVPRIQFRKQQLSITI